MSESIMPTAEEINSLLEELLVDAYGDEEQLKALNEGIEDTLELLIDVLIVGKSMSHTL